MPLLLPQIKVCGVTRSEDVKLLSAAGVDAIGINLVPTSRRYVPLDLAIELAVLARSLKLVTVAVVMNPVAEDLHSIVDRFRWDFIQLHGAEPVELRNATNGIAIIKASSWSGRAAESQLVSEWACLSQTDAMPPSTGTSASLAGFLIDAYAPGIGGGTGHVADWQALNPRPAQFGSWPLMLAGGLVPDNVAEAIERSGCDAVDTASGVERCPGIKDEKLVFEFAANARRALPRR